MVQPDALERAEEPFPAPVNLRSVKCHDGGQDMLVSLSKETGPVA